MTETRAQLPQSRPSWPTVRVEVGTDEIDWVSGELWAWGCTGIAEEPLAGGRVTLVAGFPTVAGAQAAAAGCAGTCVIVDGADWLDVWRDHFEPVRVGSVLITPAWRPVEVTPMPGEVRIELDPGWAFGTGGHASTRVALGLLQRLPLVGARVLDVGCGSGVLAVAAVRLGASHAVAIDIDEEAVRVTAENAVRNGVAERVHVSTAELSVVPGGFDVVLANILAPVLIDLGADIARHVNQFLVLAGLIEDQVERVLAAYPALTLTHRIDDPPWVGLLLEVNPR